jgi:hypothetical protein
MKKVAASLRNHRPLILNWFGAHRTISAGTVEGFNNKAKLTTRKAYGFRTSEGVKLALYHTLAALPEPEFTHELCWAGWFQSSLAGSAPQGGGNQPVARASCVYFPSGLSLRVEDVINLFVAHSRRKVLRSTTIVRLLLCWSYTRFISAMSSNQPMM